jgi:hypothetical protein
MIILKKLLNLIIGPIPDEQLAPPREPKIMFPVIDEKAQISKQLVDIVIKDLEKYAPSEWHTTRHSYDVYEHKCLSYKLLKMGRDMVILEHHYSTFLENDKIRLYNAFIPKYEKALELAKIERNKKQLAEFLDDSKRILCKEND